MLPKEAIEEFKKIYEREEGRKIGAVEAVALANNLMGLFKKIYKGPVDKKGRA